MENRSPMINALREWYQKHTEGALTQYQPKFWGIFWITAALGVGLYFLMDTYVAPHLSQNGTFLLSTLCLGLPLFALRNLHPQAMILIGGSILTILW